MAPDPAATIPPRIFQTWKSRTRIPPLLAAWSDSFRRLNPRFEHVLWDDADNRAFIAREFAWFLPVYDAYPAEIYRADAVRYFHLYLHGGIYADMDTECLQPLDELCTRRGVVLGRMGADDGFSHAVPNAIMASAPRAEFWLLAIALLRATARYQGRPELLTGPVLLQSALRLYEARDPLLVPNLIQEVAERLLPHQQPAPGRSTLELLPARCWYPLAWNDPVHDLVRTRVLAGGPLQPGERERLFRGASMVTYWAHTWEPQPGVASAGAGT